MGGGWVLGGCGRRHRERAVALRRGREGVGAGREGEGGGRVSLRLFFLNLNDYIASLFIVLYRLVS